MTGNNVHSLDILRTPRQQPKLLASRFGKRSNTLDFKGDPHSTPNTTPSCRSARSEKRRYATKSHLLQIASPAKEDIAPLFH
jgi:hypothetical protein